METNTKEKKPPRYFTDQETQAELRNRFPETVEVQSRESLDYEIEQVLNPNPKNINPRESQSPEDRKLCEGMVFVMMTEGGVHTFEIQDIDDATGMITLWD